jgi:hypothetical protein
MARTITQKNKKEGQGFYKFGPWTPCKAGRKVKSIDHGS